MTNGQQERGGPIRPPLRTQPEEESKRRRRRLPVAVIAHTTLNDPAMLEAWGRAYLRLARRLRRQRRPGRPTSSDVTEALRLESEGVSRKEIYGWLGKKSHEEQHALREAMRQRKFRLRRRQRGQFPQVPAK